MIKKKSDMVVKSNSLIEASYHLSLNELRMLDMALARLTEFDVQEKISCCFDDAVTIRASDYANLYGVDINTAYDNLKAASKTLRGRYFTIKLASDIFDGRTETWDFNWVRGVGYVEGEGVVMLAFTPELTEMAGQLKSNFSRYHLEQKSKLTSIYAHRLYETLMQWRTSKTVPQISYKELRERFGIGKKEYATMSNFKRVVLSPAMNQINEHTDITVSVEQQKEGRKVVGFVFKFKLKKNPKKQLSDESTKDKDTPDLFHQLTEKQLSYFSSLLANDSQFGGKYGKTGEDMKAFEFRIKRELTDIRNQEKWLPDLKRVGYGKAK